MTDEEKAKRIKTFCEVYFASHENTRWPTFREVSRAVRIPIRAIADLIEGHDYGFQRTYFNTDWSKVAKGDFFLEIV